MHFKVGTLSALVAAGNAFVIRLQGPLASTRLDPILSPGKPSGHQHTFLGGNTLKADLGDFTGVQHCSCTCGRGDARLFSVLGSAVICPVACNKTYTALPLVDARAYYTDVSLRSCNFCWPSTVKILILLCSGKLLGRR